MESVVVYDNFELMASAQAHVSEKGQEQQNDLAYAVSVMITK